MESPKAAGTGVATDGVVLGQDLGFILGAVFRSYIKAATVVVDEIPGGARGYQVVSAAVHGAVESQRGLARRLGVDRTVMTYLLDDLEEAGLVARRPDPADRRNRHVLATDKGREMCTHTERRLRSVEDHVLDELSPEEREMLRGMLGRVAIRAVAADPIENTCTELENLAGEPEESSPRRKRPRRR